MTRIGLKFLLYWSILAGLTLGFLLVVGLTHWLLPDLLGPLPSWLPEDLIPGLFSQWLSDWFDWVPAVTFSAVILTFSFGLKKDDLPNNEAAILVRVAILAIVASVLFALLELLGHPWIDARLAELNYRYEQTRDLEDAYLKLKGRGPGQQTATDLEARFQLLKRLGTLRPEQSQSNAKERFDYDFELQILKAHLDLDEFFKARALPGSDASSEANASVKELLDRAEAALASQSSDQEYQANLWAFQAYRRLALASDQGLAPDLRDVERAKTLVDESWARVYERTLAFDERAKASYFFRKGKSLGDFQFQNYLEAYYGFQELYHENPRDAEVARHWELSREKVAEQVLFAQEMDVLFAVPGSEHLVYLNRSEPLELVRIGKLLNTSQGVFVKDFEFLRTSRTGQVLLHWTAPYGRWTETGIDFRVWDKELPTPRFPVVLQETEGNEFNPEQTVDPPLFRPRVSVRDLELLNASSPQPQSLGTFDLLTHGQGIEALGFNSRPFQTEFLVRMAGPWSFFVMFLFSVFVAWGHRAREQGQSWRFLFPLLPLVMDFLVQASVWAFRLSVGGLLSFWGLETTAGILTGTLLILTVVGLVLVHSTFEASRNQGASV